MAAQSGEFSPGDISIPILKIGQPLTREVEEGNAEVGEFINTLTGEGVGKEIGFVISYYAKGRAGADRETGRYYVSNDFDIIPETWADFVGEEFVGTRFDEYPDAEETYKDRVNRKEIPWGKGPKISTTHNYTGLALFSALEDSEDDVDVQPVRLSLQRTNMEAVRKINSMVQMKLRNQPVWSRVFDLGTAPKQFAQGRAHLLTVKLGRPTTEDERQEALEIAQAVLAGRVVANEEGNAPSEPVAPDANGGLGV